MKRTAPGQCFWRLGKSFRLVDDLDDARFADTNGQVYSRTPFGYERKGDVLIPNQMQQKALAMARRMAATGASLRQIASQLTGKGLHHHGTSSDMRLECDQS